MRYFSDTRGADTRTDLPSDGSSTSVLAVNSIPAGEWIAQATFSAFTDANSPLDRVVCELIARPVLGDDVTIGSVYVSNHDELQRDYSRSGFGVAVQGHFTVDVSDVYASVRLSCRRLRGGDGSGAVLPHRSLIVFGTPTDQPTS